MNAHLNRHACILSSISNCIYKMQQIDQMCNRKADMGFGQAFKVTDEAYLSSYAKHLFEKKGNNNIAIEQKHNNIATKQNHNPNRIQINLQQHLL